MSFFKKVLSSVGIGAAKVDAVLDATDFAAGDTLSGVVHITGGNAPQSINKIDLDVRCNYFAEEEYEVRRDDDVEYETRIVERDATLVSYDIGESFEIQPGEQKQIPFRIELPLDAPLTLGKSSTWLQTNLDIDFALDKKDKDYIHIVPNAFQQQVLSAIESLGLRLHEAECEESRQFHLPFVQELEFKAYGGRFAGRIDELEIIFMNYPNKIAVLMEVDRAARGVKGFFSEMLDMDESKVAVEFDDTNIADAESMLRELIDERL